MVTQDTDIEYIEVVLPERSWVHVAMNVCVCVDNG